ncbi:MAG: PA14 domain-containing protein [bacterium]
MKNKKFKIKALFSDSRYVLLLSLILLSLAVLYKTVKFNTTVEKKIKLTLSQQSEAIKDLHDERKTVLTKVFFVDEVDFPLSSHAFTHVHLKSLSSYQFKDNFFVDLETNLKVIKEGVYEFTVCSDDGFSLIMGDKVVIESTGPREMQCSTANIAFPVTGTYPLRIQYFQGLGLMGLKATYKNEKDKRVYIVGEDSPFMTYSLPN